MKKLNGTFQVIDLEQLLFEMEFDNEDQELINKLSEKNTPLIEANSKFGQSIFLTFSEAPKGFCILSHSKDEDIINSTISDIRPLIKRL